MTEMWMFVPRGLMEGLRAEKLGLGLWRYNGYTVYDETYPRPEPTEEQWAEFDKSFSGPIGTLRG